LPYGDKFVTDFSVIENDPEITVVAEVMGGVGAAYEFTKRCLKAGKSVCTSNKELVATRGEELLALAKAHNVGYMFEASVGGGIPLIRPMLQCLAANEINEICGILNGTTNYILTQMINGGVSFEDALASAQAKGYAEQDPTADIEGHDACRKICILSDLAFGDKLDPDKVECEGITKITLRDVACADKLGRVIKLIGRAVRNDDGTAYAYVAPHLIDKDSPLATVHGVFNAVMIDGNATGEVMFYGKGAGKLATASAVVADMMDCAFHRDRRRPIFWGDGSKNLLRPLDTLESSWYVRFAGAKADLEAAVPADSITETEGEFVAVTRKVSTVDMKAQLEALGAAGKVCSAMRLL
ncbi:MAG: homoserine dehydrogenase, partial [Intestinibacillus sp.]